jgi:hypothetical protein
MPDIPTPTEEDHLRLIAAQRDLLRSNQSQLDWMISEKKRLLAALTWIHDHSRDDLLRMAIQDVVDGFEWRAPHA